MRHCTCKTYPLDYDPRKTLEIRISEAECDNINCSNNKSNLQMDDPDWSLYTTPLSTTIRSGSRSKHFSQSVFKYIVRALSESSISGVNKLFSAKSQFQRFLWALVLVACLSGFSYQTYHFSILYRRKPSVVQIEVENDGLAEFPAITLCNTNRLRKSEFCKYKSEICDENSTNLTLSEPEIGEIIFEILSEKKSAQKKLLGHTADMIQSCIFNGRPIVGEEECMKMVEHSYDPDYGNCYTIPPRNTKGEILEAREADFWQEANDLSLLVDMESDELLERKRRPGMIVTVHDDSSSPDIHTDGQMLSPGFSYTLAIQKTSIHLLPLPYKTNCTDYTSLPWQKTSKRRHTSRLCTVGCSQYYQLQKCKFVTKNLSLFYEELPYNPKRITEDDTLCAETEEQRTQDYCRSICGLPCRDTIFVVTTGSTPLTERDIYDHHIHSRLNRTWEDKMKNLVHLKIYFSTLEHTIYRHMPKYDTMELFSYLGGYSGVWLGFSLLTVYELIEILVCAAQFAFQKHQRALQHRKVFRRIVNTKKHSKAFLKKRRFNK
ncbi:uncharacterized protein NPIL_315571 [Nephila pilipes]|uniref:Uncharacterized protein n=1 Tax=Nephila pilipes TaxID=299642 RepID=A0A8X6N1M3_NEPPI|nr:uncharacterized protein NPIL_315571 [Nephila pilipes]